MNVQKTQFQIFSKNNIAINMELDINGILLKNVRVVKLLGFMIDDGLTWSAHVQHILSKLGKSKFLFERSKRLMTADVMKIFYYSHFYSHVCYGISLWGPMCQKGDFNKLFRKQKDFIRSMSNAKYNAHTEPLFKSLNILKLRDCVICEMSKFGYMLKHDLLPPKITSIFEHKNIHRNTRNTSLPHIPPHKTSKFNNSFIVKGISCYKKLPLSVQLKPSLNSFISSVKKYLTSSQVSMAL